MMKIIYKIWMKLSELKLINSRINKMKKDIPKFRMN